MNEVFLEGIATSIAKRAHPTTTSHHLIIRLQTTHRNRQGQRKHEVYTVNAWNRLADWADKHLAAGVPVLVRGYLTQQTHDGVTATEITASQFIIKQAAPTRKKPRPPRPMNERRRTTTDAALQTIIEAALRQGLWAALYIYLFFRMLKENAVREEKYQAMIHDLSTHIAEGIEDIQHRLDVLDQ